MYNSKGFRNLLFLLILIGILLLIFGCEKTECYECTKTFTIEVNFEWDIYPMVTTSNIVVCTTEQEIREYEKEQSKIEVMTYSDIVLTETTVMECLTNLHRKGTGGKK